ncbi:MAG TPA: DMT family transporter [Candidatus Acidoferrales bacterium]|nr:DMT family transporter [Candidatus Acidoferrales bacterium]
MTALAVALAVSSAGLHATWNVLLKAAGDPQRLAARAVAVGTAALTLPLAVVWLAAGRPGLPAAAWGLALLSGLAELAYFSLLSSAYQRGELSVVYPLARSTGPLVAVLGGLLLLGERLTPLQGLGVAALLAGIFALRRPTGAGPAVLPALATGLAIGAYTLLDRAGVRMGPVWLYAWVKFAFTASFLVAWARVRPGPRLEAPLPRVALVGCLILLAYGLVLVALSLAPVAVVAPARESAIVLVAAWGVWRLRERGGLALRVAGAAAVLAGVVLTAAG